MNTRADSSFASSRDGGNAAYKARYGATAIEGARPQRRSERLLGSAAGDAGGMRGLSNTLTNDYMSTFRPLQSRMAATAELDGQSMADQAAVDVSAAFDRTHGEMYRDLSRMGINPNSGRFAGLAQKWGRAKAAATAGSMTRARRVAQSQNFNRLLQATNVGLSNVGRAGNLLSGAGNMSRGLANDWGDIAHGQGLLGAREDGARPGSLQDTLNSYLTEI